MAESPHLADAVMTVTRRIAGMVGPLPDPDIPIPRSEWTVGDAAAHIAFTNLGMSLIARGLDVQYAEEPTRASLAEANANSLASFPEHEMGDLARRVVEGATLCLQEAAVQPAGAVCITPMGTMTIEALTAYLLTHNLMHGCAIAEALGEPYPFEPGHLALMWPFLSHALPVMFDSEAAAGLHACIDVRISNGFRFAMVIEDGHLTILPAPDRPVDCTVEAEPLAFFLVSVRLMTAGETIDAGMATISGLDPGLGAKLLELFEVP